MKLKTSVALDEETLISMQELIRTKQFRNKSHLMEYAIFQIIEKQKNEMNSKL